MESWKAPLARPLPPAIKFNEVFDGALVESNQALEKLKTQQRLSIRRFLERYYTRGGYPRLYSGEVDDGRWADYLVQMVFESVLGADISDLFPVESPGLLRYIYLQIARMTGQEIAQNRLAAMAVEAGFAANQPTVGKSCATWRMLCSFASSDASRWPRREDPADRRSHILGVDFVAERVDGTVLPLEVKFRKRIDPRDLSGVPAFQRRFGSPLAVIVTRDHSRWDPDARRLYIPLQNFLLAF